MEVEYKYEVAFSFLSRDESLAQRLNDLIQDKLSTFIYPERQLEIAGKDGEVVLKKAFGVESRIVVILYRKEWGTTPFTRMEQDAIRDRAYSNGYDFCILVPLESPPTKPDWFPPHRLWVGLERWGKEAAAAVIEARVHEVGGITREETLTDRKARLERQIVSAEKRKAFLGSEQAVKPANQEAQSVLQKVEELSKALSTSTFPLEFKNDYRGVKITSAGIILQAYWHIAFGNSLIDSGFYLRFLQIGTNESYDEKKTEIAKIEFEFTINESDQYGWHTLSNKKDFYSSQELAEYAIRLLMDKAAAIRQKRAN